MMTQMRRTSKIKVKLERERKRERTKMVNKTER